MLLSLVQLCGLVAGIAVYFSTSDPIGRSIARGAAMLVLACVAASLIARLCARWLPALVVGSWLLAVLPFAVAGWNWLSHVRRSRRA